MNSINNLTNELITKRGAEEFVWSLDEIKVSLYKTNVTPVTLIKKRFSFELATALLSHFKEVGVEFENKQSFGKVITSIQQQVNKLPIVELTTAITPSAAFLEKSAETIEHQLNKHILINVTVDPSIIAGAIVRFNGKVIDYTLANKLT